MGLVMYAGRITDASGPVRWLRAHRVHHVKVYGRLWLACWAGLGGLSLLVGVGSWPVPSLVGVFVTSGIVAGAIAALPEVVADDRLVNAVQPTWRVILTGLVGGLVVTTILVSLSGLGALVGPLLALAVLTSPWTIRCALRAALRPRLGESSEQQRKPHPERARVALQASDWKAAVQSLTDEELCTSWRVSYAILEVACSTDRVELVTLRQAYLDDLERRNPGGLRAWLDSGARAAGNPARYVATDHRGVQAQI